MRRPTAIASWSEPSGGMLLQTNNKISGPTLDLVADFHQVFQYDFMTNGFLAGTVVAILAGVVGYFVVLRRLSFACEALSHGGFAGATGAVVLGQDVFLGLLVFTSVTGGFMGLLGDRLRPDPSPDQALQRHRRPADGQIHRPQRAAPSLLPVGHGRGPCLGGQTPAHAVREEPER